MWEVFLGYFYTGYFFISCNTETFLPINVINNNHGKVNLLYSVHHSSTFGIFQDFGSIISLILQSLAHQLEKSDV